MFSLKKIVSRHFLTINSAVRGDARDVMDILTQMDDFIDIRQADSVYLLLKN